MNFHQQRSYEMSEERHRQRLLKQLPAALEGVDPPATSQEVAAMAAQFAASYASLELGGAIARNAALDRGALENPQAYLLLSRMFPSTNQ